MDGNIPEFINHWNCSLGHAIVSGNSGVVAISTGAGKSNGKSVTVVTPPLLLKGYLDCPGCCALCAFSARFLPTPGLVLVSSSTNSFLLELRADDQLRNNLLTPYTPTLYSYRYGLTGMQNQHDDPKQNQHRMMQLNNLTSSKSPLKRYTSTKQPL